MYELIAIHTNPRGALEGCRYEAHWKAENLRSYGRTKAECVAKLAAKLAEREKEGGGR